MSEKNQTKTVAFRLGLAEFDQLEAAAKAADKTPTEVARQCVRDRLNGNEFIEIARQEIRRGVQEMEQVVFTSAEKIHLVAVGDVEDMKLHINKQ